MKTILALILIILQLQLFAQVSYQYDENGNRTARIIDLGKDIEPK